MGHGKKYKSKRQLKKDMPQNKLMEMGLIRKAKWTDELGDRSWKEGPFRNRAVETWNDDKTVYKGSKTNIPGQREWTKKKSVENDWGDFLKRKTHGVEIDGKEYQMKAYRIPRSKKAKSKGKLGLFAIKDPVHREMYRNVK